MRTEYLATFPALWGHRNTATLTTMMVPPETGCFFLAAAVYDNLDCSDVIDSPHFSIATKLLEVINSHLLLLVPPPLFHEHTARAHLWSFAAMNIQQACCLCPADTPVMLLQMSLQAGRPLNGTANCQWMLLDKQFVIVLLLIQTLLDFLCSRGMTSLPWLFLQVDSSELQNSLTNLSIIVRGESVSRPLNVVQAANGRDAFVKVLVLTDSLFKDWGCFQSCPSSWLRSPMW